MMTSPLFRSRRACCAVGLVIVVGVFGVTPVWAQYATVFYPAGTGATTVNVPAGNTLTVDTLSTTGGAGVGLSYLVGNKSNVFPVARGDVVAGPADVSFAVNLTGSTPGILLCTYHLSDATGTGVSLPSNSVVVPANATGGVQVTLEQSTDLVTWTAATPGTYGSSTSKRFFRVRAVQQ